VAALEQPDDDAVTDDGLVDILDTGLDQQQPADLGFRKIDSDRKMPTLSFDDIRFGFYRFDEVSAAASKDDIAKGSLKHVFHNICCKNLYLSAII
jgi:hypothetical protein